MNASEPKYAVETALTQARLYAVRNYLRGRRGLILLTVSTLVVGAAFNWNWLAAVGVAPILLTIAPCAAMCALGLCMNKAMGRSCSTDFEPIEQSSGERDQSRPSATAQTSR